MRGELDEKTKEGAAGGSTVFKMDGRRRNTPRGAKTDKI